MFDYIKSEALLPVSRKTKTVLDENWYKDLEFQTKDLDNTLTYYKIGKTGKLYYEKVEGEHVRTMTEAEEKKARRSRCFVWPYKFNEISRKWIKADHTGIVNFYGSPLDKNGNEWWIEYQAKFVDGQLKGKLKIVKEEIFATKEELETRRLEIEQLMNTYASAPKAKVRRFLRENTCGVYNNIVYLASDFFLDISKGLTKVGYWVRRTF